MAGPAAGEAQDTGTTCCYLHLVLLHENTRCYKFLSFATYLAILQLFFEDPKMLNYIIKKMGTISFKFLKVHNFTIDLIVSNMKLNSPNTTTFHVQL